MRKEIERKKDCEGVDGDKYRPIKRGGESKRNLEELLEKDNVRETECYTETGLVQNEKERREGEVERKRERERERE